MNPTEKRISTGSQELDAMLHGGFLPGSSNLVEGAAGTGKTTLGIQFLVAGLEQGEKALIITFEEYPQQYLDCALELGWDLPKLQAEEKLEIIFTTPEEFVELVDEENKKLTQLIEDKGITRVVVDSITNIEKLARDPGELRAIETDIVNYFKREEVTAVILKENRNILGGWDISSNKIPFIVDCYLLLRYLELDSEIKRGLMILKMRGSNHDKAIRSYEIREKGLHIGEPFHGVTGIFLGTGSPVKQR